MILQEQGSESTLHGIMCIPVDHGSRRSGGFPCSRPDFSEEHQCTGDLNGWGVEKMHIRQTGVE